MAHLFTVGYMYTASYIYAEILFSTCSKYLFYHETFKQWKNKLMYLRLDFFIGLPHKA